MYRRSLRRIALSYAKDRPFRTGLIGQIETLVTVSMCILIYFFLIIPILHNIATWAMTLLWNLLCSTNCLITPLAKIVNRCTSDIQMHCSSCLLKPCNHTHFDTKKFLVVYFLERFQTDPAINPTTATAPVIIPIPGTALAHALMKFISKLTDESIPLHSILNQCTQALCLHISGLNR